MSLLRDFEGGKEGVGDGDLFLFSFGEGEEGVSLLSDFGDGDFGGEEGGLGLETVPSS